MPEFKGQVEAEGDTYRSRSPARYGSFRDTRSVRRTSPIERKAALGRRRLLKAACLILGSKQDRQDCRLFGRLGGLWPGSHALSQRHDYTQP